MVSYLVGRRIPELGLRAAFGQDGLIFPLIVSTIGVLIAIVGVFITRLRASDRNGLTALRPTIRALADAEGLDAHRLAVDVRFEDET